MEREGAYRKSHAAVTGGGSALRRYQDVVIGRRGVWETFYYEWCVWGGALPGAAGLAFRRIFWPRLFGRCGRGVTFGARVILRHPHRIHLGERVVVSEDCVLDGRNLDSDEAIVLDDDVMLSNAVILSSKGGRITIGKHTGIGAQTIVQSTHGSPVSLGGDVIIGPRGYLVGGGNYRTARLDVPIWRQGIEPDAGVTVGDDVWLGANVTVLGGVEIGGGSVIGAGAVVTRSVPPRSVARGVPAKVVGSRTGTAGSGSGCRNG